MPDITVINQPLDGNLGDFLISCFEDSDFKVVNIIVAFAKNSGVLRLKPSLEQFKAHGSKINVYVGIDLDGTSYEALVSLSKLADRLYVVHAESDQTFHSKIYNFTKEDSSIVAVGSNNLTAGGLWTNLESCSIVRLALDKESDCEVQHQIDLYMSDLVSMQGLSMEIRSQEDIEELLVAGYVLKEARIRIRRESVIKRAAKEGIGNIKPFIKRIKATIPPIKSEERQKSIKSNESLTKDEMSTDVSEPIFDKLNKDGNSIWFETRKMTGGSRNILDLSKKSLVKQGNPQHTAFSIDGSSTEMKGGVQFFGIDPADIDSIIDVTINYNGVDYKGNTIKYPVGDKANGTWRLQIKGESSDGKNIKEAFEKNYLTNKILVFTKIDEGYFFMSVFDDSDLSEFVDVSKVVAYNGGNKGSRLLGLW
mgnify:CR=1 FL=1|jgi:hypothetical protein